MKFARIEKTKQGIISVSLFVNDIYVAVFHGYDYSVRMDNILKDYRIYIMTDPMFISKSIHVDDYTCLTHKTNVSNNMKEVTRQGCGASDCTHNFQFRCTLTKINTDKTSKCLTFKQKL